MFKISVVDGCKQRRLIVEGSLVGACDIELEMACERALADLDGREPVIEVKNVTAISQAVENVLSGLIKKGVKFQCSGIFTKHVLRQIARRVRKNGEERNRPGNRWEYEEQGAAAVPTHSRFLQMSASHR